MECTLCGKKFTGASPHKSFPMCPECYREAHGADMRAARVLKFEPADRVGATAGGFDLLVGPEGSRSDEAWLRDRGVGRVLTVAGHSEHLPRFNGVEYLVLEVDDDPEDDLAVHLPTALSFIDGPPPDPSRPHVLVHCVSGISRSGTVAIAHCMQQRALNFNDALALVRTGRPSVHPNSGFWRQLRELEAAMRQAGTLAAPGTSAATGPNATSSSAAVDRPPQATASAKSATRGNPSADGYQTDDKVVKGASRSPRGGIATFGNAEDEDVDDLALSALVVDKDEDERLAAEEEAAATAAAAAAASGAEGAQSQATESDARATPLSPGKSEGKDHSLLGTSSVVMVEPPVSDDAIAVATSASDLLGIFAEASTPEMPNDDCSRRAGPSHTGITVPDTSSISDCAEGTAVDEWVVVAGSD